MDASEIKVDPEAKVDAAIEKVFGRKIAIAMNALDWKFKETAMKIIYKSTEKFLDFQNN